MTRPELQALLFDIEGACELIARFTSRKTLDDYRADPMMRSAVERQLEIVGEAMRAAAEIEPTLRADITGLDQIVGLRNRLAHAYASIADEVIWGIVEGSLPLLRREVRTLVSASEA